MSLTKQAFMNRYVVDTGVVLDALFAVKEKYAHVYPELSERYGELFEDIAQEIIDALKTAPVVEGCGHDDVRD